MKRSKPSSTSTAMSTIYRYILYTILNQTYCATISDPVYNLIDRTYIHNSFNIYMCYIYTEGQTTTAITWDRAGNYAISSINLLIDSMTISNTTIRSIRNDMSISSSDSIPYVTSIHTCILHDGHIHRDSSINGAT